MVNWLEIEEKLNGVKVEEVALAKILDAEWTQKSYNVLVSLEDVAFEFDLRRLTGPLGDYWKTLYDAKDYSSIKDALTKYWKYKGTPKIFAEVADTPKEAIYLRSKVATTDRIKEKMVDLNKVISDINETFPYTRSIIGTDGLHLEVQFLNSNERKEVRKNDFVDCGLFINVNGGVRVAPGINRLVCTNGLTEQMHLLDGKDFKVNPEFLTRAAGLATWLTQKATQRVEGIREISIALKDYPGPFLNRFWKSWSERVDLKELTWFDVVSDITQAVNRTLGSIRYKALAMPQAVTAYEETECRCPTCSASVEKVQ